MTKGASTGRRVGVGVFGVQPETVARDIYRIAVPADEKAAQLSVESGGFDAAWPVQRFEMEPK